MQSVYHNHQESFKEFSWIQQISWLLVSNIHESFKKLNKSCRNLMEYIANECYILFKDQVFSNSDMTWKRNLSICNGFVFSITLYQLFFVVIYFFTIYFGYSVSCLNISYQYTWINYVYLSLASFFIRLFSIWYPSKACGLSSLDQSNSVEKKIIGISWLSNKIY